MWSFHTAAMAAAWLEAALQNPVVVQCPAPVSESALKWWLQSVVPVAGGTLIAVLTSVYNRRLEHKQWLRNQKAIHVQWLRDQKKAEWSHLFESVSRIFRIVHLGSTMNRDVLDSISSELKPAIQALSATQANCIFLKQFRLDTEDGKRISEFVKSAENIANGMRLQLEMFEAKEAQIQTAGKVTDVENENRLNLVNSILNTGFSLAREASNLLVWLQQEAEKDLLD